MCVYVCVCISGRVGFTGDVGRVWYCISICICKIYHTAESRDLETVLHGQGPNTDTPIPILHFHFHLHNQNPFTH